MPSFIAPQCPYSVRGCSEDYAFVGGASSNHRTLQIENRHLRSLWWPYPLDYGWFGEHWSIAVLTALIGVLLSTDYQVVDEYISSTLYEWIQNTESLLDAVEQNYYAARYAHEGYEPIELTYWEENGHFRATVPAERPIHPGIRFLIRCTVDSQDNEFSYPLPFCTAEVESVSPE